MLSEWPHSSKLKEITNCRRSSCEHFRLVSFWKRQQKIEVLDLALLFPWELGPQFLNLENKDNHSVVPPSLNCEAHCRPRAHERKEEFSSDCGSGRGSSRAGWGFGASVHAEEWFSKWGLQISSNASPGNFFRNAHSRAPPKLNPRETPEWAQQSVF